MVYNYYEVYEAEWLAEQEALEWLAHEADMEDHPFDD